MAKLEDMAEAFQEFADSLGAQEIGEFAVSRGVPATEAVGNTSETLGVCISQLVRAGVKPLDIGLIAYFTASSFAKAIHELHQHRET